MDNKRISEEVYQRVQLFHTDSVICGVSALALKTNAPNILRDEAIKEYSVNPSLRERPEGGAAVSRCFGSKVWVHAEKAIVANVSAVREWDSNGTVFGYEPSRPGHNAGEFGHNDFYPVVIAACHSQKIYSGQDAIKGMILLDEIRGRLAEVFSLKTYKIDHVVHGAIASAATYGAMMGASAEQIEHAIGMVVAHYIPWRAIRAGKQLSDSKGASAALSTEVAIQSVHRAMRGFIGPKDIFRNPEALFRQFQPTDTNDVSPFDIVLGNKGDDFAVMGMHFKLGLYEHQSAGAIQAIINMLHTQRDTLLSENNPENIERIRITAYEPAFGIIGDPAKRSPKTRQSADHSMVYIISTLIKKAFDKVEAIKDDKDLEDLWKTLMLSPLDYRKEAIVDPVTRKLMDKIEFVHGGVEYDSKYPEGIPTSMEVHTKGGKVLDSGLVMFPGGHARCKNISVDEVLRHKFKLLGKLGLEKSEMIRFIVELQNIGDLSNDELQDIYDCNIRFSGEPIDELPAVTKPFAYE